MRSELHEASERTGDGAPPPRHPADFVGDRRRFLELAGASLALATSGCLPQPKETIVPYVNPPEYAVPGQPRFFATAITLGGYATGVLVESHLGRPTRIDGNPDHPASLGAADAITQSAVLSLYDPDRSQAITFQGTIRTWEALAQAVEAVLARHAQAGGAKVSVLTEAVTSPTLAAQFERWLAANPNARWHQYEPLSCDNLYEGLRLAYGRPLEARWHVERADVIVAFDADFLASGPGHLRYARDFMSRRQPEALTDAGSTKLNRLYVVEPMPTPTGATADHRLALSPGRVAAAIRYMAEKVGAEPGNEPFVVDLSADARRWLDIAASDLAAHRGTGLVLAGATLPPAAQALVARLNAALGNVGVSVEYTEPVVARGNSQRDSLRSLVDDIERGEVDLLVVLEGNPAFTAPVDLEFAARLRQAALTIHLSAYQDETSACCHWHVPVAHPLESWSDARAFDGTVSLIQPLIAPLYGGKTCHEIMALLAGEKNRPSYEIVREHWRQHHGDEEFESFWRRSLHAGVVEGTSLPAIDVAAGEDAQAIPLSFSQDDFASDGLEIALRPDPTIFDGRFANNGWLQELPKPITKLTWQNAALLSPATGQRLGVASEDLVEVSAGNRRLTLPAWIVPGHADECVTIHVGHGRTRGGRACIGAGANAYLLRTTASPWLVRGAELRRPGRRQSLPCTQHHHEMMGRDLVREASFADWGRDSGPALDRTREPQGVTLYESPDAGREIDEYAWGMSINLATCVACNACVVACQAENNIPVVGPEQVQRGREMHWIRVDSYFEGSDAAPRIHHQPVPCMHCENAPCEVVCPVGATVHSTEGLNEMVYNRCVGTRYCSNNCPYKVRRFNFLDYHRDQSPVLELLPNPDVTVRSRGVMEKCTYCVQRINAARISAKREGRTIRDGEVIPACQAACPTQAIVFGNLHDPSSRVAQRKSLPLDYGLLTELNTRPRTTYLPRLSNPHPDLS
jgi:Fe-S-cluster-containing dehydrogenase component/anaerobic selenocysteine-containing dehydrogenase